MPLAYLKEEQKPTGDPICEVRWPLQDDVDLYEGEPAITITTIC